MEKGFICVPGFKSSSSYSGGTTAVCPLIVIPNPNSRNYIMEQLITLWPESRKKGNGRGSQNPHNLSISYKMVPFTGTQHLTKATP